jgi:hypothetical protein
MHASSVRTHSTRVREAAESAGGVDVVSAFAYGPARSGLSS